jgi:hypothetical protein
MSTPDLSRKVLGYRTFRLDPHGQLSSVSTDNTWMPGPNRARCDAGTFGGLYYYALGTPPRQTPPPPPEAPPHDAPVQDCTCGLYAFHAIPPGWFTGGLRAPTFNPAGGIAGGAGAVITAWGRIEVHHNGFRAEYAQIVALVHDPYDGPHARAQLQKAADLYHVRLIEVRDVTTDPELQQLGDRVPDQLLPKQPTIADLERLPRLILPPPFPSPMGASGARYTAPPSPPAFFVPPSSAAPSFPAVQAIAAALNTAPSPPSRPPMHPSWSIATGLNLTLAGWNAYRLAEHGVHLLNLIALIVNLAWVGVLLHVRRKQCARYAQD